jgi:hypothetical protein
MEKSAPVPHRWRHKRVRGLAGGTPASDAARQRYFAIKPLLEMTFGSTPEPGAWPKRRSM